MSFIKDKDHHHHHENSHDHSHDNTENGENIRTQEKPPIKKPGLKKSSNFIADSKPSPYLIAPVDKFKAFQESLVREGRQLSWDHQSHVGVHVRKSANGSELRKSGNVSELRKSVQPSALRKSQNPQGNVRSTPTSLANVTDDDIEAAAAAFGFGAQSSNLRSSALRSSGAPNTEAIKKAEHESYVQGKQILEGTLNKISRALRKSRSPARSSKESKIQDNNSENEQTQSFNQPLWPEMENHNNSHHGNSSNSNNNNNNSNNSRVKFKAKTLEDLLIDPDSLDYPEDKVQSQSQGHIIPMNPPSFTSIIKSTPWSVKNYKGEAGAGGVLDINDLVKNFGIHTVEEENDDCASPISFSSPLGVSIIKDDGRVEQLGIEKMQPNNNNNNNEPPTSLSDPKQGVGEGATTSVVPPKPKLKKQATVSSGGQLGGLNESPANSLPTTEFPTPAPAPAPLSPSIPLSPSLSTFSQTIKTPPKKEKSQSKLPIFLRPSEQSRLDRIINTSEQMQSQRKQNLSPSHASNAASLRLDPYIPINNINNNNNNSNTLSPPHPPPPSVSSSQSFGFSQLLSSDLSYERKAEEKQNSLLSSSDLFSQFESHGILNGGGGGGGGGGGEGEPHPSSSSTCTSSHSYSNRHQSQRLLPLSPTTLNSPSTSFLQERYTINNNNISSSHSSPSFFLSNSLTPIQPPSPHFSQLPSSSTSFSGTSLASSNHLTKSTSSSSAAARFRLPPAWKDLLNNNNNNNNNTRLSRVETLPRSRIEPSIPPQFWKIKL